MPEYCPANIRERQDFDASVSKIVKVSPRAAAAAARARQSVLFPDPPFLFMTSTTLIPWPMKPTSLVVPPIAFLAMSTTDVFYLIARILFCEVRHVYPF